MTIIEVNYEIKRTHCPCCERPLDNSSSKNTTAKLDITEMKEYAPIGDGTAYVDDLKKFIDLYLFDYYGEYLSEGSYAYFSKKEQRKVLDNFVELLSEQGYEIVE